jgi:hypothetical protein
MIDNPPATNAPQWRAARPCRRQARRLPGALMLAILGAGWAMPAGAQDRTPSAPPQRPTILFHRWQEDWSVLAEPGVPREPLDSLKYLPIAGPPGSYLSLGLNLRERLETNDAAAFGTGQRQADGYLLQRLQLHADLRLGAHVQVFTQLEDARTLDKAQVGPVDANRLDLRQAFVAVTGPLAGGIYKVRAGRQEMGFDLQRFVAVRDGPNVRQAFDALWLDWERAPWRVITFASHPVQYRSERTFDDYSNGRLRFGGFRVERQHVGPGDLSAYVARYRRDGARFLTAAGNEVRNILDLRYAGSRAGLDWDLEAMRQTGHVGGTAIRAWATGARIGYTVADTAWAPRLGIQADTASGDRHPDDRRLGTFNPLFPNGYYFTLAGYTGYANLLHLKPSLTVHPTSRLTAMFALGAQWRQTVADAVYIQPNLPVAGTAGHGGRWSGAYAQLRFDYQVNRNLAADLEAVHYRAGHAIRQAGGHDGDYLELELKFGW